MAQYETVFILRPDLDEESVTKTCDRLVSLISEHKGGVLSLEKMGHRRLAYEVEGHNDGYYVVMNFEGPAEAAAELERSFRISDEAIRYLLVRREVPYQPPQPKAAKAPAEAETVDEQPQAGNEEAEAAPDDGEPPAQPDAPAAAETPAEGDTKE